MDYLNATPIIVAACYAIAELLKKTLLKTDSKRKLLPVICSILGIVIAVACFYLFPELLPNCNSVITAIITGCCSGLAATGCNQVYKQIQKAAENTENETIIIENDDDEGY